MMKKHLMIMLVCCLVPIVALGAILLFNLPVSSVIWIGLILICPLSHLFMMKFMMQDNHDHLMSHSARPLGGEKGEFEAHLPTD